MTSNPAPAVPWLALVRGETSGSRCSQGHGCMAGMWLLLRPAVGGNRAGEAPPPSGMGLAALPLPVSAPGRGCGSGRGQGGHALACRSYFTRGQGTALSPAQLVLGPASSLTPCLGIFIASQRHCKPTGMCELLAWEVRGGRASHRGTAMAGPLSGSMEAAGRCLGTGWTCRVSLGIGSALFIRFGFGLPFAGDLDPHRI